MRRWVTTTSGCVGSRYVITSPAWRDDARAGRTTASARGQAYLEAQKLALRRGEGTVSGACLTTQHRVADQFRHQPIGGGNGRRSRRGIHRTGPVVGTVKASCVTGGRAAGVARLDD